jgi:hypothetical protein
MDKWRDFQMERILIPVLACLLERKISILDHFGYSFFILYDSCKHIHQ